MAADEALSGRNIWLGIGKQTAFGTPVAPTKFYEVTEISGLMPEYDYKKSDRRVGTRFKPLGFKSGKRIPLSFTVEVNAENIGLLLALGFGTDVISAAGAAYQHLITLVENLPYFTAWASTDYVADSAADATLHTAINCKVVSLSLDGTSDDVLKCKVEAIGTLNAPAFVAKTGIAATGASASTSLTGLASTVGLVPGMSVTGTGIGANAKIVSVAATSIVLSVANTAAVTSINVASPTPVFPASRSLYIKAEEGQAKVELGATVAGLAQFDETTEFHFSLSNGVAPDNRIDNTAYAAALREGDSELTGSLKVVYNRASFVEIKAFQAGTARALRFTATSVELAATSQPFKLVLTADKVRYSGAAPAFDPDVITADMQYEVERTTSYPTIAIINADNAAYI